jgi:hypothetical protein
MNFVELILEAIFDNTLTKGIMYWIGNKEYLYTFSSKENDHLFVIFEKPEFWNFFLSFPKSKDNFIVKKLVEFKQKNNINNSIKEQLINSEKTRNDFINWLKQDIKSDGGYKVYLNCLKEIINLDNLNFIKIVSENSFSNEKIFNF